MLATKSLSGSRSRRRSSQAGTTAIEVALLSVIFIMLVFGILELARLMYVYNTLQEVTRRAASELANLAPADPDSDELIAVRRRAIFQTSENRLALSPVEVQHVRVEYLALTRDTTNGKMQMELVSSLPSSSVENHETCMNDPNAPACVRFVRVSICQPGAPGACDALPMKLIIPLIDFTVDLPRSTTIATAESLGYLPGTRP